MQATCLKAVAFRAPPTLFSPPQTGKTLNSRPFISLTYKTKIPNICSKVTFPNSYAKPSNRRFHLPLFVSQGETTDTDDKVESQESQIQNHQDINKETPAELGSGDSSSGTRCVDVYLDIIVTTINDILFGTFLGLLTLAGIMHVSIFRRWIHNRYGDATRLQEKSRTRFENEFRMSRNFVDSYLKMILTVYYFWRILDTWVNVKDESAENYISFTQVQDIEQQYEKLDKLLKKLQDAHEESKAVTKAAAMKEIKERMDKDTDEVGKTARTIKFWIEELDKDNLANRQKPGCGKGTGVDRSRTMTTVALKKRFKDKISEFQTLRENIHQEYREVVERRVFTVMGNRADEETIDRMIETGNSEQIFQKAIGEQGRGQIMDPLAKIQECHDAVRKLERKLFDLQQIFLDMDGLVDIQGDMLDNIESQVSSAVDHVQSGNTALQKAKKLQRNSTKWTCCAIMILLITVVIVAMGRPGPMARQRKHGFQQPP